MVWHWKKLFIFYSGDGSCGGRKCHRNGVCKADVDDNKQCECLQGFLGNGYICVGTIDCFTS